MRIALCIEYDGSLFSGWQKQNDVDSIQGDIEKALESIALEKLDTYASGRTDTGVHALIQIIHFDTIIERPITAWVRGVNAFCRLLFVFCGLRKWMIHSMRDILPHNVTMNIWYITLLCLLRYGQIKQAGFTMLLISIK